MQAKIPAASTASSAESPTAKNQQHQRPQHDLHVFFVRSRNKHIFNMQHNQVYNRVIQRMAKQQQKNVNDYLSILESF